MKMLKTWSISTSNCTSSTVAEQKNFYLPVGKCQYGWSPSFFPEAFCASRLKTNFLWTSLEWPPIPFSSPFQLATATPRVPRRPSAGRTAAVSVAQASWGPDVTCARRTTSTTAPLLAASSARPVTLWSETRWGWLSAHITLFRACPTCHRMFVLKKESWRETRVRFSNSFYSPI